LNISGASESIMNHISKIISKANHTRHFGANALELCYFARGFMDAYIDIRGKIRSTDIAAAYLIVKESGGRLYSITGSELDAELGTSTRLSFLAVLDENMFKNLSEDLHMS